MSEETAPAMATRPGEQVPLHEANLQQRRARADQNKIADDAAKAAADSVHAIVMGKPGASRRVRKNLRAPITD